MVSKTLPNHHPQLRIHISFRFPIFNVAEVAQRRFVLVAADHPSKENSIAELTPQQSSQYNRVFNLTIGCVLPASQLSRRYELVFCHGLHSLVACILRSHQSTLVSRCPQIQENADKLQMVRSSPLNSILPWNHQTLERVGSLVPFHLRFQPCVCLFQGEISMMPYALLLLSFLHAPCPCLVEQAFALSACLRGLQALLRALLPMSLCAWHWHWKNCVCFLLLLWLHLHFLLCR